jgi:hypothetical protein
VTGRRRQRWQGGHNTRKAAEAALRELIAEVDRGGYVARSSVTVAQYLDEGLPTMVTTLHKSMESSVSASDIPW